MQKSPVSHFKIQMVKLKNEAIDWKHTNLQFEISQAVQGKGRGLPALCFVLTGVLTCVFQWGPAFAVLYSNPYDPVKACVSAPFREVQST